MAVSSSTLALPIPRAYRSSFHSPSQLKRSDSSLRFLVRFGTQRSLYCRRYSALRLRVLCARESRDKIYAMQGSPVDFDVLRLRTNSPIAIFVSNLSKSSIVTKDSWERSILKSHKPVLVEFYASWCGPCRMVHRIIDEITREYEGELDCFVLNTDNDLAVADDYDIKAVPVVLLFKDGERRESIMGTMPKKFYTDAIDRVLKS